MTFYSSLFLGFCVGVLTVFGFHKIQKRKSEQRKQRAVENAMLGAMNKDDLGKLLPRALFPSWVQFQDFERVKWFNMQLKDLWPHINKATQETIREVVEPMLQKDYRPAMVSSIFFRRLTLGNVPPEIEGVQVANTGQERILLLFQVKWAGNPSMFLTIKPVVGPSVSIQVKDIRFWGTFRVAFEDLVDRLPCFGAITVALTQKPTVTYAAKVIGGGVVGGDINSIPWLGDMVDTILKDAINESLVWPCRILIPILPGDYSHLELHEVGKLDVKLVEAKLSDDEQNVVGALMEKTVGKTIDLYAKLYIRRVRGQMFDSFCALNTDHPLWGQAFQLPVEDKETQQLIIEVWAKGELGGDTKLGKASEPLKGLKALDVDDIWREVFEETKEAGDIPKAVGKVHMELMYRPLGEDGKPLEPMEEYADLVRPSAHRSLAEAAAAQAARQAPSADAGPQSWVRGVIRVTVLRGKNLISKDSNGLSDPFITVNLLKEPDVRKKSKVLFKTLNPEWDQSFELLVNDARNDMLVVRVFDHDLLGMKDNMGWVALTFTKVIRSRVIEGEFPLEEGGDGVLEMRLEWRTVMT